ncbi:MAG: sigma-70 family RNA polymerase sigma factor [Novosphingobium sp.]
MAVAGAYTGDIADRVRQFMPLVRKLAWHVHGGGRPDMEVEDLMQAGLVALTECAQRHEGPSEDGFAAYAKMRVRGAMIDLVRRSLPISRGGAERRRQLADKERELTGNLGRAPTSAELADAMGMTQNDLATMQAASEPLRFESIDDHYSDHDSTFAADMPDSLSQMVDDETRGQLVAAISALPDRLKLVVQLYFVEELNLSEIAEVLGVSIPRVHQLKAQAIKQLRDALVGVAEII